MSYQTMIEGLKERMETVDGAADVLDYEPQTIGPTPCIYLRFEGYSRRQAGQVTTMHYRVLARAVFLWQDNQKSEHELIPFVNSIAAAIDADPEMGGRVTRGSVQVDPDQSARGGWVPIGDILYRVLDVFIDITEKAAYQSGI